MKRFLLDTNVISELRKTKPHGAAVAWIRSLRPIQVFVSTASIGELQRGAEITKRQDPQKASELESWIDTVVDQVQLLTMDEACFREWARIMQHKTIDGMIAATARVHELIVATRNESDFKQFGVEIVNPFITK